MIWKGKNLRTTADLADAIFKITDQIEAGEFMKLYRAENPNADDNVGYMSGSFGMEDMQRIQNLFGVKHPVFGKKVPTFEEAYKAGFHWGKGHN
ncbi:MAG: hypothetical protein JST16_05410 [Bdellovibrionales bacterium]|nr:hypothetical protein [Bdellovibrionales bacterium]